ncbi:MAG: (Fe-S)-binding protein [Proteobacteria bacterium]|nr:(Fe-S)-binding protein [Desulfobacteraceae bacterium]MBU4054397.1 (Fe-S)-binding protein [Pseudomonadota bacterium]MBU4318651.1 (Fe-S)-binding protein [Pseudomonadota bacterium]MBU4469666.1 (Fe-S)-binding protein [Pseudomonadota bacterium]MCG2751749.1 (Fe-S)-binding protein [Desulfobacteraceae bacterium]
MPQGKLCNKKPITTEDELHELLADKSGKRYYEEMQSLDVDASEIEALFRKSFKSRLKSWLEICTHCALCAESCFFYLANHKDPKQVPSYKIQSTLGELVRRKGRVDNTFMRMTMDTAWSKCTCCNRCALYCPFGIDMGVMFSYLRGICFSQGFVPWELKIGSGMHRIYRAQMDITTEDWVDTCQWMVEENEEEWPGLEIPVDKENADIIYTVNAREPKHYPEDLAHAAILFHVAGENWTVPSVGWEETSLAMFAGDWEGSRMQVETVYESLTRLKAKRMVVTECGHAYRATVIEGPYWAGLASGKTPIETFHYVEWVAEALRTGRLKIDPARKIKEPVTYQDSCNYIRNGGLADITREIMGYIAEDFREMTPCREHNFCCGGGGGLNGIGIYREQRNIGLKVKKDQILATGAKLVISPCHNCWDAIRDLEEVYHIGIRWSFLKPLLLNMIEVPEHLLPRS